MTKTFFLEGRPGKRLCLKINLRFLQNENYIKKASPTKVAGFEMFNIYLCHTSEVLKIEEDWGELSILIGKS